LIFEWNPHLKEILLFHKLATAEVIIIDKEKSAEIKEDKRTLNEEAEEQTPANVKPLVHFGRSA
jgi:hypothetical protein